MQEGRCAARAIIASVQRRDAGRPFAYVDKGSLATIGRWAAVADIRGRRFGGAPAWAAWLFVHLLSLVGLENRLIVFIRWLLSFTTHGRAQRLMTGESVVADFDQDAGGELVPATRRG
jgi:NADH dehydrogenase